MKFKWFAFAVSGLFLLTEKGQCQDLDPRAYAWAPVNMTFLVAGFGYSHGGVLTDPTVPIKDLHAAVESPSVAAGYTYRLFGQTAQIAAAMPYAWAQLSGIAGGIAQSTDRSGLGDIRLRFSMLLTGAPASTRAELAKAERHTIVGTSLTIVAPTGQYFAEKLINIGTSRWAFKPEIAFSQPFGKRWLVDFYSGLWLFTENDSFFPGNSVRTQDPMGSFQAHVSYNFKPRMWAALDLTYYTGGRSSVDGVESNDRQSNSRFGGTMVIPAGKLNSVKIAFSTGAIIRAGADFTTLSIGWQTSFFGKSVSKTD